MADEPPTEPPPHLFGAEEEGTRHARLRDIPFRMLVPSLITLGAICSGLTAIRFAWEGRFELAVAAILFAAILDAIDGRVARFLKSETPFGEQLDSLADFVNFGVAPALMLYTWTLREIASFGWMITLFFAICGCLRLARFNVELDGERADWEVDFFTGVPAPAGAVIVLLPLYLDLLGFDKVTATPWVTALYTLFIGALMASTYATWSLKRAGQRVSQKYVVPVILLFMLLIVGLFSYPWSFLTVGSILYLAAIPFSVRDFRRRAAGS